MYFRGLILKVVKHKASKPNPDPENMQLIKTKEGSFYRKRRGKGAKGAVLNERFAANRDLVKLLSPAAAKLQRELRPFLVGLKCGRLHNRIQSRLSKSLTESGRMDYMHLMFLQFQPDYPLGGVLLVNPKLEPGGKYLKVHVPIPEGGAIVRKGEVVSGYRFVLVLVVGDPFSEGPLYSYQAASGMYELEKGYEDGCTLKLVRPDGTEPWMVCLRIVTYERDRVAINGRHSGMMMLGYG